MKKLIVVKLYKIRLILINFTILISLFFVIIKKFNNIRFTKIIDNSGEIFILDRFTSKIRQKL